MTDNQITMNAIWQLKGEWRIEQLSPLLSVCYRRPSFELVETAAQATPEMNDIPHWMEATFKWSTCLEEFVYQQMNSFNVRLWPNSISAGSFLLQLPSPLSNWVKNLISHKIQSVIPHSIRSGGFQYAEFCKHWLQELCSGLHLPQFVVGACSYTYDNGASYSRAGSNGNETFKMGPG